MYSPPSFHSGTLTHGQPTVQLWLYLPITHMILASRVTLGQLFKFPKTQFSHVKMRTMVLPQRVVQCTR